MKNKGNEQYPSLTDFVSAAIIGFSEGKGNGIEPVIITESDRIELGKYLADEMEKRIRPIVRGPVGK